MRLSIIYMCLHIRTLRIIYFFVHRPHTQNERRTFIYMNNPSSELTPFEKWLDDLGICRQTGWRWRKSNVVSTVNIFGKLYITSEEILRFKERALSGEFYLEPKTPKKEKSHEEGPQYGK